MLGPDVLQRIVLVIPGFLIAVTVHEYCHGYMALRLGDATAKLEGRLTFNPISHIDPFGALALILTQMIGWAKPVPVDPRNLRDPRRDMVWISLGGPAANLVTAGAIALFLHAVVLVFGNTGLFNSSAGYVSVPFLSMLAYAVVINVGLGIFNLVPVPPLDGSKILSGLLPREQANAYESLEPYGFVILLLLIFTGVVGKIIEPPIMFIVNALLGGLL